MKIRCPSCGKQMQRLHNHEYMAMVRMASKRINDRVPFLVMDCMSVVGERLEFVDASKMNTVGRRFIEDIKRAVMAVRRKHVQDLR